MGLSPPVDSPFVSGVGETISVDTSVTQWGNWVFKVKLLSADLYPGNTGCGSYPLQSTRSVAGCRLYSFGVPAMTLVVSCPPWQGLNHTADWARRPPPLHTLSSPTWTSSPCKCKTAPADSSSQLSSEHQHFFCVCGKTCHHIDQSTLEAGPLFLLRHEGDPSPNCAVITYKRCTLLLSMFS